MPDVLKSLPPLVGGLDQPLLVYALGAALVLTVLFNLPRVGPLFRGLFSFAVLAGVILLFLQQAPYSPGLGKIAGRLGIDNQQVNGDDVRIRLSPDGHFWARARIDGVDRRLLVDSGATVTVISRDTADRAEIAHSRGLMPMVLQTANGAVIAETGKIRSLTIGGIEARNLKVVVSPAPRSIDVLGMNFLSRLAAWRVEDDVLVLVPRPAGGGGVP